MHVGIVSLTYPPLRHVAALRASRFARELVGLGARVTVYTASSTDQPALPSDSDDQLKVIRVDCPAMTLWPTPRQGSVVARKAATAARRLGDGAFSEWVHAMMDEVVSAGAPSSPPTVLWAIHGSDSAHALARQLGHHFNVPWVADYKDNWNHGTSRLSTVAAYIAHRRRTSSAALCTAASTLGAEHLRKALRRRAEAIYTGVDIDVWQACDAKDLGARFNIVFTGHASTTAMATDILARGLIGALEACPPGSLAVHYFGHSGDWLRTQIEEAGFGSCYRDHGFTDRDEVACAQKAADLLLHLPYLKLPLICVKFFEYLASGRPILSVPAERDPWGVADGVVVARTPAEVSLAITAEVDRWSKHGRTRTVSRDLSAYAWAAQAERLLSLLREVARSNMPSQAMGPA